MNVEDILEKDIICVGTTETSMHSQCIVEARMCEVIIDTRVEQCLMSKVIVDQLGWSIEE